MPSQFHFKKSLAKNIFMLKDKAFIKVTLKIWEREERFSVELESSLNKEICLNLTRQHPSRKLSDNVIAT